MSRGPKLPLVEVMDDSGSALRSSERGLLFVLITIFVDSIGIGIIIPVIPKLLLELVGGDYGTVALYGGWLMFLFAALQFLSAPVLGNLSDAYGRRPVLLASLAAYGVDLAIMGAAPSIGWLFVGRALSGIFGATYVAANAYIADVTPLEDRARSFGWMGAAFGFGFTVGPAIGGLLGDLDHRLPFFVAAALAGLNTTYGYLVLPESLPVAERRPFSLRRAHAVGTLRRMFRLPVVGALLGALFLYNVAHDANPSTWTFVTMEKFGWTPFDVGMSMTFMGICVVVVQGFGIRPVVQRLGEHRAVLWGFGLFAVSFLGFAFAGYGWMMFAWMVPYSVGSVAGPTTAGILSRQVPPNFQGELQGALSALRSLTSCFAPLLMTGLFNAFTRPEATVHFSGASFFAAALLTVAAVLFIVQAFVQERRAS